jgi:hypothetical protein
LGAKTLWSERNKGVMSHDFTTYSIHLAALVSIVFAFLLMAISITAAIRVRRSPVPVIAADRRSRRFQIIVAIGISIAIIIVALPSALHPDDAQRFPRFYGILWPSIRFVSSAFLFFFIGFAVKRNLPDNTNDAQ